MSLFLPREVGSIETGPQTFAGTNVLNTTFLFRKEPVPVEPPGLLNSVLVSNGGQNSLNGIFSFSVEFNGKQYYNKDFNSDLFIVWFENEWGIYDFSISFDPIYFSPEDVQYPWNVVSWSALNPIYNPVPTATKVL